MDLLDVCYKSDMRLFRDSPTLVSGRWKRCPPGAIVYPGWHAFGSQTQDPEVFKDIEPTIGEARGRNGQVIGTTTPGYSGQRFCGDANAWEFGNLLSQQGSLPIDSRGRPVCCGAVDPGMIRVNSSGFATPARQWFLRTDPGVPPVILPSDSSPLWNAPSGLLNVNLLAGTPGSTPDSLDFTRSYSVFGPLRDFGPLLAFVTAGLSAQELPAQVLTLTIGYELVTTLHTSILMEAEIWLIDGTDGSYKQAMGFLQPMTPLTTTLPHLGRFIQFTTAPISIAAGDYFFVGFGIKILDSHLPLHEYDVNWEWEGTDPVTSNGQAVTTTKAVFTLTDA
jgi:hypothetical protein